MVFTQRRSKMLIAILAGLLSNTLRRNSTIDEQNGQWQAIICRQTLMRAWHAVAAVYRRPEAATTSLVREILI